MLGRAAQVPRLVESLAASTDRARLLFLVTQGDRKVRSAVSKHDHIVVDPRERGDYAAKINLGVRCSSEPLIFTGAIDLHFHPGWLEAASALLSPTVQVVGTNDLSGRRPPHSTHTLVTRDYAKRGLVDGRPGLLCEDYLHEYVDDELVGTASRRGVYAYAADAVVEHLHPMLGKADWDDTYKAMRRRMRADRVLFNTRRRLWT